MLLAVACGGWGRAAATALGLRAGDGLSACQRVWLGWAAVLALFQLANLFLALTVYVVAPVLIAGVALAAPSIAHAVRQNVRHRPPATGPAMALVLLLASAGWVASRAMLSPTNYDTGLYHLASIRWINTFRAVQGLGNLHGRLAFNQSFFTYVAALNLHPLFGHGPSVANSFLFLLTLASAVESVGPALRRPMLLVEAPPYRHAPGLFVLPALGYLALTSNGMASPTPDLTSVFLQMTIFLGFTRIAVRRAGGLAPLPGDLAVVMVLAATAITVKLSNLGFAVSVVASCLVVVRRRTPDDLKAMGRIVLLSAVPVLIWAIRGVIASGCLAYPSTLGCLPVDWAVPVDQVAAEAEVVYTYARRPGEGLTTAGGGWVVPWLGRAWGSVVRVSGPFIATLVLAGAGLAVRQRFRATPRRSPRWLDWVGLPPLVGALAYWLAMAPEPRFSHALFWLLALAGGMLALASVQPVLKPRRYAVALGVVFVIANLHFLGYIGLNLDTLGHISVSGWHPVPEVRLVERQTRSGLVVYTPLDGEQTWDAPLPAAPQLNPDLRLRVQGRLGAGFAVTVSRSGPVP